MQTPCYSKASEGLSCAEVFSSLARSLFILESLFNYRELMNLKTL
jgi:hypothetical protein